MWKIISSRVCVSGRTLESFGVSKGGVDIYDISTNRREIEELVERLNRFGASEIHAFELVEDFLGR